MAALVAAVGGAALAVSVLAGLLVEALVDGVDGADATVGSGLELGVEGLALEAVSVVKGVEAGAELGVAACVLAAGEVERGAGATLARLAALVGSAAVLGALALLRLAFGGVATATSATLAALSRVSVVVVDATSAGAEVPGATLPEPVLLAVCTAVGGTWISASLYLWLKNSAPPITDAVMTPNASPKWFTESS